MANTTQNIVNKSNGVTKEQEEKLLKQQLLKKEKQQEQRLLGYQTDRFIIKYKDNTSREKVKSKTKNNIQAVQTSRNLKIKQSKKSKQERVDVVTTNTKMDKEALLQAFKNQELDSEIEYIQPDYPLSIASNDPYYPYQWGVYNPETITTSTYTETTVGQAVYEAVYARIDANVSPAWLETEGEGIIVAVIDTGIDINHEDLSMNIWTNTNEIDNNGIDDDGNGYIDDINGWNIVNQTNQVHKEDAYEDERHGTHISGIIAGQKDNDTGITGIAPKAKIMPLTVFQDGTAYTSDIIEAIAYAENMGAAIVNCSWGTTEENRALQEAIEESNMLFVTAAGNNSINIDNTPIYPASYTNTNIITVASINKNGTLSSYTNYGQNTVNVAAPGEDILSTLPNNQYGYTSGTSMATAFVSGEAALILSQNNTQSPEETKEQIKASSNRYTTLLNKIERGNIINCENAVNNININTDQIIVIPETEELSVSESVYEEVYKVGTYILFSIDPASIEQNTETLKKQAETLNILLEEMKAINQLIQLVKQTQQTTGQIEENTQNISQNAETLKIIQNEINVLHQLITYTKEENNTQAKINANIEAIKEHTLTLNMLLRELKALNELVIAQEGNVEIDCIEGKIYNLLFTGENLTNTTGTIQYKVRYNTDEIEIIDLCGLTQAEETTTGNIQEAGIEITEHDTTQGVITFTVDKSIATGKTWSGILNGIKFKAKQSGITEIETRRK